MGRNAIGRARSNGATNLSSCRQPALTIFAANASNFISSRCVHGALGFALRAAAEIASARTALGRQLNGAPLVGVHHDAL